MLPFKNAGKSLSSTRCVSLTMTQLSLLGSGWECRRGVLGSPGRTASLHPTSSHHQPRL